MNKVLLVSFITLVVCLFSFRSKPGLIYVEFVVQNKWPKPTYNFDKNPVSQEGFELGRKLFYDVSLSRDSSISCASCHLQYSGFTHVDHPLSHGIEGKKGSRNSPVLINLAWNNSFHWDGGVNHLDVQGINPIQHPAEMGNTLVEVLKRLNSSSYYSDRFEQVFGESTITTAMLMKALSQFTVSLVSSNSKYDQVMRREKGIKFTDQEKKGMSLFVKNCASCHTQPLFTNSFFASNGLPIDTLLNDVGRYEITKVGKDSMQFKIPTLRNVEFSFPYMHDGRFKKLKDVINYYSEGIDPKDPYLHPKLKGPFHFTDVEKKDLHAFLLTLTDKSFLYDKRFSYPK